MKAYNGFTAAQRNRAQAWLNVQWNMGFLNRPKVCVACGQDKGVIDAHAEDYSEPFESGKTDEFHLCFRCHMMIHCRFSSPDAFARYADAVQKGRMFKPFFRRDWPGFVEQHLTDDQLPNPVRETLGSNVLWSIANAKRPIPYGMR